MIIILAVALIGFGIVLTVVRRLLGMGRGKRQTVYHNTAAASDGNREKARRATATVSDDGTVTVEEGELHINKQKIFGKDEGEYVPYEEVKD